MPILLCVLILWAVSAAAQTVEGSVFSSTTGRGVAGVKVEIGHAGNTIERFPDANSVLYSATTDAQGHFRIEDVKEGTYVVRYTSPDYYSIQQNPPFQVTAGGNTISLENRMIPLCGISGHVIDGRDEAVPFARLVLIPTGTPATFPANAEGRFAAPSPLFPGTYSLAVVPPLGLKPPDPEADSGRMLGWTTTYYPGVAGAEAASKIVLRPGSRLEIDIKLLAVPTHNIRGVLLNPDGTPAPKVMITADDFAPSYRTESRSDGTFELSGVVDGTWRLSAEAQSGGVKLKVAQLVEMAGRDVEGLKLKLNEPFIISGKVVMEAPQGWVAPRAPSVILYQVMPDSRSRSLRFDGPLTAPPDTDGNFSLPIYPGTYQLGRLDGLGQPEGYYFDAVWLGDTELAAPEVELFSGALAITLVYKTNGGSVSGRAERCASGGVLLVPQDPVTRSVGSRRSARCDSSGRYMIPAVRPGDYYALAVAGDPGSVSWQWVPKFDDGLVTRATRITVRAGESSLADLSAISQP